MWSGVRFGVESMKKLIVALMIFLFLNFSFNLAYASFLTSAITRLQPAAAVAGAAGSKIIPAIFTGTAAGGNVSSWISLAIPGGTVAKIAGAVLGVAGGLALDYVFNNATGWFTGHNLALFEAGLIDTTVITYPSGFDSSLYNNSTSSMYASANAASVACAAARLVSVPGYGQTGACGVYPGTDSTGGNIKRPSTEAQSIGFWRYKDLASGGPSTYYEWFYYPAAVPQTAPISGNHKVAASTAQTLLTTDLANNQANAVKVGQVSLEVAAAALDNPSHPVNMQAAIKAAMAAALMEGVTAQQKTDLELQAAVPGALPVPTTTNDPITYLTPAQIAAAVQAALAGQGLSAGQIAAAIAAAQGAAAQGLTQAQAQAAVAAALSGAGLNTATAATAAAAAQLAATNAAASAAAVAAAAQLAATPPIPPPLPPDPVVTDPTIVMPDKKSLTTVMGTFMGAINDLPMLQTLRGLTINVAGSSQLCLAMPAALGGSKCFDAGRMQDGINMIGSALLGLTTIFSFLGIFKG